MKHIVLFIFSLFIGIILVIGYPLFRYEKKAIQIYKPSITTQFSVEEAPSKSPRGTIVSSIGDVDWQSRIAAQPEKLTGTEHIQQEEKIITGNNGKVIVQFPNIATINSSPNTLLNFIQILPADIVVEQDSGLASYTKIGTIPVSIRSFDLLTTIQSGIATVSVDKNLHSTTITAEKGSVIEGFNNMQDVSTVVMINKGDQFIFNNDTKQGIVL